MSKGAPARRLALLDRDGTIIVDKIYLKDPYGIEFAPGAIEGQRLLRDAGFAFAIITNQSRLEAIYYCPRGPEDRCGCRKPRPRMVHRAMYNLGFRPDETVVIGDSDADMQAAAAAGIRGVRVAPRAQVSGAAADFLEAARRACALFGDRNRGEASCT